LRAFRIQTAGSEPTVHAHYLYDAGGERVKKVVRKQGQVEVTVYIDGLFEFHRLAQVAVQENNTLHAIDGQQRIALIRVGGPFADDMAPAVRYELGDHLSNSNVVLNEAGAVVNREEYTPFGESSFGSFVRKRYRFAGKERDEESGLTYHGARYYASWLARWVSCDQVQSKLSLDAEKGGLTSRKTLNLYAAFNLSPMRYVDPDGDTPKSPTGLARLFAYIMEWIAGEQGAVLPKPEFKPAPIEEKIKPPAPPPPPPPRPSERVGNPPRPPRELGRPPQTAERTPLEKRYRGFPTRGDRGFTNLETLQGIARGVFYVWLISRIAAVFEDALILERREQHQDVFPLTKAEKREIEQEYRLREYQESKKELTQVWQEIARKRGISVDEVQRGFKEDLKTTAWSTIRAAPVTGNTGSLGPGASGSW
jgi:RHS repeat-associated protein